MIEKKVILKNASGLHARPASIFVRESSKFKSDIYITRDDQEYNAKSIIAVLSMGAACGDEINIRAEGHDEEEALATLVSIIESNLD